MKPHIVYVKTNSDGYITAVNSSAFLSDTMDWIEIDSGYGDMYGHAQGNYFPKPIRTGSYAYRYKLKDGIPSECSREEIVEQEKGNQNVSDASLEKRVLELETGTAEIRKLLSVLTGKTEK